MMTLRRLRMDATPRAVLAGSAILVLAILVTPRDARADQTVTIGPALAFNPSTVTIVPGERVTWTWAASSHSSTSDAVAGPDAWDSGIQPLGASFSRVFSTAGTFPYYCKVHSSAGGTFMNGVVQVVVPTATPTPTTTTSVPSPSPTVAGSGGPPGGSVPTLNRTGLALLACALAFAAVALSMKTRP